MSIFKKKTLNFRRNIVSLILKIFTPNSFIDIKNFVFLNHNNSKFRGSIEIMKEYFNNLKVSGVEIGVNKGSNSLTLLKSLNIKELFLIDSWKNYIGIDKTWNTQNYLFVCKRFNNNHKVKIIKDTSKNSVKLFKNNSLDFVYIDGNHSYNYVLSDIINWYPKVKNKGFLCGHDIFTCIDVIKALKVFCIEKGISFFVKLPDWYIFKDLELTRIKTKNKLNLE